LSGAVYLVGAGPGAADLLTLRAARLLGEADIVFYDALVDAETLALAPRAEKIAVGKRCGKHSSEQRFISKRLVDAAKKHRVVVRLKGGDPMLFGRAQEEIAALAAAGIRYQVVPGVTAALAAAAELGTSLTRRGVSRSVVFATPRVGEGEGASSWAAAVRGADTAALYMASGDAEAVTRELIAAGVSPGTPVALAENVSLSDARIESGVLADLPELAQRRGGGPALLLLGEVWRAIGYARRPRAAIQMA